MRTCHQNHAIAPLWPRPSNKHIRQQRFPDVVKPALDPTLT